MHADVAERLWDNGHVDWALYYFTHEEGAVLTGPGDETFVVLTRPRRPRQFLVAALAPPGVDHPLRTDPPRGIAVAGDPIRAASSIERRLLPRYRQAVEAVRTPALRRAHSRAQEALRAWNSLSGSLCDEQGLPLDTDDYHAHQSGRDWDGWDALETFLHHGRAALDHADAVLPTLRLPDATTDRWRDHLRTLNGALDDGTRIRDTWEALIVFLLDRIHGPERWTAYGHAIEARNAHAWPAVRTFIDHASVLHSIDTAEQQRVAPLTAGTVPPPPLRLPRRAPRR
ncbi:hypothetical protein [Actinacidiphila sp. bgisy144]|uniref:hypothetical protein n=1 Tax=Actinacidiphila sp. bgisy144 TaxID=3413791 RepID=UPI003EBD1FE8